MNDYIDIYCERTAPGLMNEPLNAITNLAFFIAAFFAYRLAKKQNAIDAETSLLLLLLLAIGTGSALFHTIATGWASLADTLPILLFQIVFLSIYARRIIKLNALKTAALIAAFFLTIAAFASFPAQLLNGSLQYAPALLFVAGLGVFHFLAKKREPWALLGAAGIFLFSLIFRSIDLAICAAFTHGVHFLWHMLNACVLYLALRALLVNK